MRRFERTFVSLAVAAFTLVACGGDDDTVEDGGGGGGLSAEAQAGEAVFDAKGCSSCHGTGVGPDLEGLHGSEVELEDGATVVADDAYIERSITDPDAERVAGFEVTMPSPNVNDEEVNQLVAYIRELGSVDEAAP